MSDTNQLHQKTEARQPDPEIFKVFNALPEKFLVDFANGIDVARDHSFVQYQRSGFFARIYDGVTGQSSRRQHEINANLTNGLEGSLRWLTDLTQEVAHSNQALLRVHARVGELQSNVAQLANYSADTRDMLQELDQRLMRQADGLALEINRVDLEQRAALQLNQVFDKWEAGSFGMLPPLARLSASLEELFWGDFGCLCQTRSGSDLCNSFLSQLRHKSIIRLNTDISRMGIDSNRRVDTQTWLRIPEHSGLTIPTDDAMQALQYLGDWSDIKTHPFTHSVTQRPGTFPLELPKLMSADRAATALVNERFVESNYVC